MGEQSSNSNILLKGFVILGPLGNLLTPYFFPEQFRTYFFLLPLFPLFFTRIRKEQLFLTLLFIPFFLYSFLSVLPVEVHKASSLPFPLWRYLLLFTQFFFVLGASFSIKSRQEVVHLTTLYLKAFFISLLAGCVFYIGHYTGVISLQTLDRFSVLTQFAYGFLRFSPGSYPNEYGIVSSFVLSLLTLFFFKREESPFSQRVLFLFFILTFIALLLATTRAAYISYLISLFYIAWKTGYFFRALGWFSLAMVAILAILKPFGIDMLQVLSSAFAWEALGGGTIEIRYLQWSREWADFLKEPFLGKGFASQQDAHNVYLQCLFELGIAGALLLAGTLLTYFLATSSRPFRIFLKREWDLLKVIKVVGLIHVLWFAASNHNLNHHLTWFTLFLCFSLLSLKKESLVGRSVG